jgi:hypothetical protein
MTSTLTYILLLTSVQGLLPRPVFRLITSYIGVNGFVSVTNKRQGSEFREKELQIKLKESSTP